MSLAAKEALAKLILPAQKRSLSREQREVVEHMLTQCRQTFGDRAVNLLQIPFQKIYLSALSIKPKQAEKKCIIHCRGSNECWQDIIEQCRQDALDLNCEVIAFNYPNVIDSGKCEFSTQHMIDSIKAVIEFTPYQASDVILKGHSIGGAYACVAAGEMHREAKMVFLFDGRSFFSYQRFEQQRLKLYEDKLSVTQFPEFALEPCKFWDEIASEYKDFFNVDGDPVIADKVSMLHYVNSQSNNAQQDQHLFKAIFPGNPHSLSLQYLKNNAGMSAQEYFIEFAKRAFSFNPSATPTAHK